METRENDSGYPPAQLLGDNGSDKSLKRRFAIWKLERAHPSDNGNHDGVRFFEKLEGGAHY